MTTYFDRLPESMQKRVLGSSDFAAMCSSFAGEHMRFDATALVERLKGASGFEAEVSDLTAELQPGQPYEYWAVSDGLASELQRQEQVIVPVVGLGVVWRRSATEPDPHQDGVIRAIVVRSMPHKLEEVADQIYPNFKYAPKGLRGDHQLLPEANVYGAAFSEDGAEMAVQRHQSNVSLWVDSTRRRILKGHESFVNCVAMAGGLIATGSSDKTIRLWDRKSARLLRTLEGHQDIIMGVALSRDGSRVASCSRDNAVRLYDAKNGEFLRQLVGHTDASGAVALSGHGGRVASCSPLGPTLVWSADGSLLQKLPISATCLDVTADGGRVVSGHRNGKICVWDVGSGQLLHELSGHSGWVLSVKFSSDDRQIVSGSDDWTVRLWDAINGKPQETFRGHSEKVVSVAFCRDDTRIASVSKDGLIQAVDNPNIRIKSAVKECVG